MAKSPWGKNMFLSNLNIAVETLGYQYAPIAYGIAMSDWKSERELLEFLNIVTTRQA
jgi:hypothetical protein